MDISMGEIVTITLNPALDLTTAVERVAPFQKLRCGPMRRDPGGGGINVARVLKRWDCKVLAIYSIGGPTGELLQRLVTREQLPCHVIPVAGDTREDFTVYESTTGRQFRFVEPGSALAAGEIEHCLAVLTALQPHPRFIVASGSLPPGSAPDAYARIASAARDMGAKAVVDASGLALARALDAGVFLVKPNLRELVELRGTALEDLPARLAACQDLVQTGKAAIVALTLAEQGAIAVTAGGAWRVTAPKIEPVSTVGAGDCFLAGMIWRLLCGDDVAGALRYAVAAGSASLLSPGTSLCRAADVERLFTQTVAERVTC